MEDLNAPTSSWLVRDNYQLKRLLKRCKDIEERLEHIRQIYLPVEEMWQDPNITLFYERELALCPFAAEKGLNPSLGDKHIWLKDPEFSRIK